MPGWEIFYMTLSAKLRTAAMATVIALSLIFSAVALSDASVDYHSLVNLIENNEDARMSAPDLAYFLVTHGFDATPEGDHAKVRLGGTVYRLTPNEDAPGLADIAVLR
jgi:hypothetical protein